MLNITLPSILRVISYKMLQNFEGKNELWFALTLSKILATLSAARAQINRARTI